MGGFEYGAEVHSTRELDARLHRRARIDEAPRLGLDHDLAEVRVKQGGVDTHTGTQAGSHTQLIVPALFRVGCQEGSIGFLGVDLPAGTGRGKTLVNPGEDRSPRKTVVVDADTRENFREAVRTALFRVRRRRAFRAHVVGGDTHIFEPHTRRQDPVAEVEGVLRVVGPRLDLRLDEFVVPACTARVLVNAAVGPREAQGLETRVVTTKLVASNVLAVITNAGEQFALNAKQLVLQGQAGLDPPVVEGPGAPAPAADTAVRLRRLQRLLQAGHVIEGVVGRTQLDVFPRAVDLPEGRAFVLYPVRLS